MRRTVVVGLSILVLLGAGAAAALLNNNDSAPLPSEDELRTNGFAVWPEDTVEEGMAACEDAEPWRLDSVNTALRFAHDVLKYPEPYVTLTIGDWAPQTIRYFVATRRVPSYELPMIVDVRQYHRCWFVVGAEPREDGFPATVSFVYRSGRPHLAIKSTVDRTEVGYGSWERNVVGGEQVVLDLPDLEPAATGHVISLGTCQRACNANAWTLGFVPKPATTEVAVLTSDELVSTRGICRAGSFHSRLRALVNLYAMTVEKPIETSYGKPKVGNVVVKGQRQLRHLGIKPLSDDRWSFTVDRADLEARVIRVRDGCWSITSIDDLDYDVLKALHVDQESFTFDLRWGEATSATIALSNRRGGDSWDLERLNGPITVRILTPLPLDEPFIVSVSLRDGRTLVSYESSWYRAR
jgi:hypothetical protein